MQVVLQRVSGARVRVDGQVVGEIGAGLVALVGVAHGSEEADAQWLARKTETLRVFDADGVGEHGRMDASLAEIGGEVLAISQFTLYADVRKGRRPSFAGAAEPARAEALYEAYCAALTVPSATGVFGARMAIDLTADGPVTILLRSESGVRS